MALLAVLLPLAVASSTAAVPKLEQAQAQLAALLAVSKQAARLPVALLLVPMIAAAAVRLAMKLEPVAAVPRAALPLPELVPLVVAMLAQRQEQQQAAFQVDCRSNPSRI
jgi:hypothetical protein